METTATERPTVCGVHSHSWRSRCGRQRSAIKVATLPWQLAEGRLRYATRVYVLEWMTADLVNSWVYKYRVLWQTAPKALRFMSNIQDFKMRSVKLSIQNILHVNSTDHSFLRWQVSASSYNSNKLTNQMQQFYKSIIWPFVSLNMFRAPPRPSSGAYNCINP